MRKIYFIIVVAIISAAAIVTGGAHAQLVGTDTTPGSSCAGFPDGATRVTADADLDGQEITLVCDGTTWNASGGAIEQAGGMSAPTWGPTCTQRTATGATTTVTIACNAGEVMTGGGCSHSSTTPVFRDSGPSAAATWRCEWSTATATGTAFAICCAF